MEPPRRIHQFYREDQKDGYMSNYSRHPVVIRGKTWPTTEHFYQAMKFEGTELEEKIREKPEPAVAKKLGQSPGLREDWEEVKDAIMKEAVLAKFTQHQDLQLRLLKTGDALLVEHTKNDSYWGDGGDGSGKNMLGKTLMEVRAELRARQRGGTS